MALVSPACCLLSGLVNESVSNLELPPLRVDLVLEGFDAPFIMSDFFSLPLEELLVLNDEFFDFSLESVILLP